MSAYQALLLYGVKLIYIELSPENPLELKPSFYKINIQTGTNLLAALAAIIFIIDRISRKINLLGGLLAIFRDSPSATASRPRSRPTCSSGRGSTTIDRPG